MEHIGMIKAKLAQLPPESGVQFYINLQDQNPDLRQIFEGKVDKEGFEKAGHDFLKCMKDLVDKIGDEQTFNETVAHLVGDLKQKGVTFHHLQEAPKAFYKLLQDSAGGLNPEETAVLNEFFKKFMEAAKCAP